MTGLVSSLSCIPGTTSQKDLRNSGKLRNWVRLRNAACSVLTPDCQNACFTTSSTTHSPSNPPTLHCLLSNQCPSGANFFRAETFRAGCALRCLWSRVHCKVPEQESELVGQGRARGVGLQVTQMVQVTETGI
uniref:Uncharacterized protein n=1 Tax=Eutreptiella gymnastica TaxID=73025 RepID=A0A7S1I528_9EUGL|mmetsp:Transcript_131005/g.226764  ORF Transcript_131005/g.226764 Transcript_131005/m.226764 type:complete len:133 (+) Transcript_131005:386-784(+)